MDSQPDFHFTSGNQGGTGLVQGLIALYVRYEIVVYTPLEEALEARC